MLKGHGFTATSQEYEAVPALRLLVPAVFSVTLGQSYIWIKLSDSTLISVFFPSPTA